jgi:hypothetical protein
MLAERLWLDTLRVASVRLDQRALSNTWWPIAISDKHRIAIEDVERVLAMWFNSSFGILSLIAARVDTKGPWIELKKPIVEDLLVLNPLSMTAHGRTVLLSAYDELSHKILRPLPEISTDAVRARLDLSIARALGLRTDLAPIRALTAVEPLIVGART